MARTLFNTLRIRVPNDTALYTNANEIITGVLSAVQDASFGVFGEADWTGTAGILSDGTITDTIGNATSIDFNPRSFDTVLTPTQRTFVISLGVPDGFLNEGDIIEVTRTVTQAGALVEFFATDWTGTPSLTPGGVFQFTLGNAAALDHSIADFPRVSTPTPRNLSFSITAPTTGYTNSGQSVPITREVIHPASTEWLATDWTGSIDSINNAGTVSFTTGNSALVTITSSHTQNTGDFPRNQIITYTVDPPTSGEFAGAAFSDSITLSQPGVALTTSIPTVTTSTTFTANSANITFNGTITDPGNLQITSNGFEFGLTSSLGSSVGSFDGIGAFAATAGSLSASTTYFYRAFATNSLGTGFGSIQSAATIAVPLGSFAYANAGVSACVVNNLGFPSCTVLTSAGVRYSPTLFSLGTTSTTDTLTIFITVPAGFSNSGQEVSGTSQVTLPAVDPLFGSADWTGSVMVTSTGSITATNGNGNPISIVTGSFGTSVDDIARIVEVDVTVPSGFSNFNNIVRAQRTVTQAGVGAPTFSTVVTIMDNVSNASINVGSRTLTGEEGAGATSSFTVAADADHAINRNNVSVSSNDPTLASAVLSNDQFGQVIGAISGIIQGSNTSTILNVSGAAVSTLETLSVNITGPSSVSTHSSGIGEFEGGAVASGAGTITHAWAVSGDLTIVGSNAAESVFVRAVNGNSGGTVDLTATQGTLTASDSQNVTTTTEMEPI